MAYKHLFGPVPSRRLGISLGVDIVKHKTCNLDCIYCECGATTNLTNERQEYVPADEIIGEIKDYLKNGTYLDVITFSGWGEPTLNSSLGFMIEEIKKITDIKICVITNGVSLSDSNVRKDLMKADIVMPNLDYVTEESLIKIGRPAAGITVNKIIEGLEIFRKEYSGLMYLEVFIVEGINDSEAEIEKLKEVIGKIAPDKVQLNSLDRPSTEKWVSKASTSRLEEIKEKLGFEYVEIISKYVSREGIKGYSAGIEETIKNMIMKRPCTIEDIEEITGFKKIEINKYLDVLEKEGRIKSETGDRGVFVRYIEK